jgi:toxin ParE1/3/4
MGFKSISDYFLQNNLNAGEQFLQLFKIKCQQLVSFPRSGRSYSDIHPDVRGVAIRGFIILYQVSGDELLTSIEILRVVHRRRDLAALFDDD